MVENRPWLTVFSHLVLIAGVLVTAFPIWITFVASTHPVENLLSGMAPLWPGPDLWKNYGTILGSGMQSAGGVPVGLMMWNSLIMALMITFGKISISLIAAYAIVYFRFPFRMGCFWLIFITLMLPVEVRILPTFPGRCEPGYAQQLLGIVDPADCQCDRDLPVPAVLPDRARGAA